MNQDEFERRLRAVCKFSRPEISDSTGSERKANKRSRQTESDNATLPIKVHCLKIKPSVCDLCGKICSQGQHYERRLLHRNGFEAWRYNCTVCRLVEDPWTGEMKHSFGTATPAWDKYIRTCKAMHEDLKKLGK